MFLNYRRLAIIGAMLLGACGPQLDDSDGDDTAASATSSGSETGSEGTGHAETGHDESGEIPDACAPVANQPLDDGSSTITIRNDTDQVLFVGFDAGCALLPFEMHDGAGSEIQWKGGDCAATCEEVLDDACYECGPCQGVPLVRLGPGATFERQWAGASYIDTSIPTECAAAPCQTGCEQRLAATPGDYTVRAEARTECPSAIPEQCECVGAEVDCIVYAEEEVPLATIETNATLTHPDGSVELVFDSI